MLMGLQEAFFFPVEDEMVAILGEGLAAVSAVYILVHQGCELIVAWLLGHIGEILVWLVPFLATKGAASSPAPLRS